MPTTIEKLQGQRLGLKNIIDRFVSKIEETSDEDDDIQFQALIEKLEEKVACLLVHNDKILSLTDADAAPDEMVEAEEYTFDVEVKLRRYKQRLQRPNIGITDAADLLSHASGSGSQQASAPLPPNNQRRVNTNSSNNSGQSAPEISISSTHKLPKLILPRFDGDILQWQSFWDSFESSIHCNVNLTDVQKFNYLKAQLEGTAAMTIEGFALTNANYTRAVELLRERYGQHCKIVHANMQALLKLPSPTSTVASLRGFYDRMETYIRGLESLGQHQDMYGSLLVPVVLEKLPMDIRKNLARVNENNDWFLQDLRRAINKEINILEIGTGSSYALPEVSDYNSTALFNASANGKKTSFTISNKFGKRNTQNYSRTCAFCDQEHLSCECKNFPDTAARMNVVKQKQLCFNCLGKHRITECKSNGRCQNCHRKHHTSICKELQRKPEVELPQSEAAVFFSSSKRSNADVVLKTAIAPVSSSHNTTDAAILVDEGAQRSFITRKLADDLQLESDGIETLSLTGFGGSNNRSLQQLERTTVYIVSKRKKIPVSVLIVPTIAAPIRCGYLRSTAELPYLRGLKLAHSVKGDTLFDISLLVGADHYWDIVEDHVVRGNGPTAVKSKIGYLLSGPMPSTFHASADKHILNVLASRAQEHSILERFWSLENMGISPCEPDRKSVEYLKQYQATAIEYDNGRYHAKLPWKQDHPALPTNHNIALKRTVGAIQRLCNEPEVPRAHGDIIAEQERRGFIERVPLGQESAEQVHYIPHHSVEKESSTTPKRIVYDCSCRQSRDSPSLNDCLKSTPPALNELTSILTIVTEIEAVLNDRPLTYASTDLNDPRAYHAVAAVIRSPSYNDATR
ncbi:uncharacterized protein LOC127854555 [Dreissena polymorpha]|uniref:uncharacterized protein LOC127854555 n=1 Tax=Dreissena polymorpha TaxID=45954 RepID=UPI002263C03D|nr:uncharacterized protein LOC127854555 [Dreissena polymorpha]